MPRLVHGADAARCCSLVAWRRVCLAACCLASVSRLVVIVLGIWPSSELALPELLAELQTLPRNLSLASGWCGHMGFTESRKTGAIACARVSTRHQRRARVVFAGCARDVSSRLTNVVSMLARLEEQLGGRRSATVIFENDSADDTRAQLLAWAELQRASSVQLLLARRVRGPRTVRLAGCRNALLGEAVALGARFLVMLDLDCKRALPDARPYGPPCWRRACLVCRQR